MPRVIRAESQHPRFESKTYFFYETLSPQHFASMTQMIRGLMNTHGLYDWKYKIDHAQMRAGLCDYMSRTLTFSKYLFLNMEISADQIKNIVLHEIAHAIVGPDAGHTEIWRRKAIEIGCDGNQYHNMMLYPPRAFVSCPCAKTMRYVYRITKTATKGVCRHCRGNLSLTNFTFKML